jgi:CheY-like chemotaxis protein
MELNLTGKNILIFEGSSLVSDVLKDAFNRAGARVWVTGKVITAFDLVQRVRFDGAVLDHGMHNEVFELCEELREAGIPYICCNAPHRLQGMEARKGEAEHAVWRLNSVLHRNEVLDPHMLGSKTASEARAN